MPEPPAGPVLEPGALFLEVMKLGPAYCWHAVALLSFFCASCYLLRTALMVELPFAGWVHAWICTLTLLPAIVLAVVLVWAAYCYPDRAWRNLGYIAIVYVAWAAGGGVTRMVRPDTEGADVGWLTMGALVTFTTGAIAAIVT
jgi:hypothetical protein